MCSEVSFECSGGGGGGVEVGRGGGKGGTAYMDRLNTLAFRCWGRRRRQRRPAAKQFNPIKSDMEKEMYLRQRNRQYEGVAAKTC